jgi:hypothetical protein
MTDGVDMGGGSAVRSRTSVRWAAAIGVATAAIALAGNTSAAADAGARPETAFALAGQGLLNFGPLTRTAAPDGNPTHAEAVGLASVPGLAQAGITGGLLTSDARTGYAASTVADLEMAALLAADAVTTTCENGRGKVEISNGVLLGTALPQFPVRGQTLDLALAKATFGEEKRNADGTITVTGIKVSVLPTGVVPTLPNITNIAHVTVDEPDEGTDEGDDSQETAEEDTVAPATPRTATSPRAAPTVPKSTSAVPGPVAVPIPSVVGSLPGLPNLPLPELTPGRPAQTVTIGSATCGTVDQKPLGRPVGNHQGSAEDRREPSVDDADDAPAPEVVEAELPVTG